MPDIKPVEKRASVLSFKRKGKPASVKEEVLVSLFLRIKHLFYAHLF